MKCRLIEKIEKQLGVSAFQKKKIHPKDTKVCFSKAFLPSYQAFSDNTYTNTPKSVLRISYPEHKYIALLISETLRELMEGLEAGNFSIICPSKHLQRQCLYHSAFIFIFIFIFFFIFIFIFILILIYHQ